MKQVHLMKQVDQVLTYTMSLCTLTFLGCSSVERHSVWRNLREGFCLFTSGLQLFAQHLPGWHLIDAIFASSSQKRFIGKSAVSISLKSPISFLRCGKCLTKLYCSRECLKEDLRTKHEDACKEESDPRKVKVKDERKVRKEGEKARVEASSADFMNRLEGTEAGNSLREEFKKISLGPYANSKM